MKISTDMPGEIPFEIMEGSAGLQATDVAHIIVPGRMRSANGMGLHEFSVQRALTAADFFVDHRLADSGGVAVCSGYKTPRDRTAELWRDPKTGREFEGVPEAIGMQAVMVMRGVDPTAIRAETDSIDSATNLVQSQAFSPNDGRPVAIVAQEQHLVSFMEVVAPRLLRRDFLGVVVPELPGNPDIDTRIMQFMRRVVTHGLTPDDPKSVSKPYKRASRIWATAIALDRVTKFKKMHKILD